MPTYVMLTNLTSEGVKTIRNNPARVSEVNHEVEAPSEEVMAKVSIEMGSRGTMTSQTLTALSAERLAEVL